MMKKCLKRRRKEGNKELDINIKYKYLHYIYLHYRIISHLILSGILE